MNALLGNRGLVGRNLRQQHQFLHQFNTSNMPQYYDGSYSTVVCSAAPASMLMASRNPISDGESIDQLIEQLSRLKCRNFVLISTIAVLAGDRDCNNEGVVDFEKQEVYASNRRRLEIYCSERFDTCLVVRLPALFGLGLKKNFIFDILNPVPSFLTMALCDSIRDMLPSHLTSMFFGALEWVDSISMYKLDRHKVDTSPHKSELENCLVSNGLSALSFTNPESVFQFYNLSRLWADIEVGLAAGLQLLHISPAPLRANDIYHSVTNKEMPSSERRIHGEKYTQDMQTCHGQLWGSHNSYIIQEEEAMDEIVKFYSSCRDSH